MAQTKLSALFGRAAERAILVLSDLCVIAFCIAILIGLVFGVCYGLSNLFDKSRFAKYYESPRVQELIEVLRAHGVEITPEEIIRHIEDPLAAFVSGLMHFLETGFLTLMMLGFLLLGQLTAMHPQVPHMVGLIDNLAVGGGEPTDWGCGPGSRQPSAAGTPRSNRGGKATPLMEMDSVVGNPVAVQQHLHHSLKLNAPQSDLDLASGSLEKSQDPHSVCNLDFPYSNNRFLQESYELTLHAKHTVQWYIILKTFMSFLLALCVGVCLYCVDVDFWFVFTVMAFLLNYIPTVGGAVSIIAPLIITILDPTKGVSDILVVFTIPGSAHVLCGNVIEPHLFGSAFDLHPIVVMFCLVVWSSLWGVTGAVLSVPLTCCLKLALKPNVTRHPYAMFLYHALEFRLPEEKMLEVFDLGQGTPNIPDLETALSRK